MFETTADEDAPQTALSATQRNVSRRAKMNAAEFVIYEGQIPNGLVRCFVVRRTRRQVRSSPAMSVTETREADDFGINVVC